MKFAQAIASYRRYYHSISQDSPRALRNPWILAWLGVIGVFLLVNLVFIIFAFTSNPGLVDEDYYEKGQAYEQNMLKLRAAQQALRWETKLSTPENLVATRPGVFRFSAVDARGLPIMDADVRLLAYRPSDANADFSQPLHQVAPGQYQNKIQLPLPGVWDINVSVQSGADNYETIQRVTVQPAVQ